MMWFWIFLAATLGAINGAVLVVLLAALMTGGR